MTSGMFTSFPVSCITVNRGSRQRREISSEDIESLADSMARKGLIHPIVITRQGDLIAGETRLMAAKHLGWANITAQFVDDLSQTDLKEIELEENVKRKDLSWQDKCRALFELHSLYGETHPEWSEVETAKAIGYADRTVREQLRVARELVNGNEQVAKATEYSTAKGIVIRKDERARADEADLLSSTIKPNGKPKSDPFQVADFNRWVKTYSGQPFNFVHCDFPYGIGADKFNQGAAKSFGGYSDTEENYWTLVGSLINNKEKLLGEGAHIIFWFSPTLYQKTLDALRSVFWVEDYPLIWNKVNMGIIPNPRMCPRRVYEMAFFCSYKNRPIIRSVPNLATASIVREGAHMSEKAEEALVHFFKMVVDENTRMLDPTCGSGSALRAARSLGAKNLVGLELNKEFVENARLAFKKE